MPEMTQRFALVVLLAAVACARPASDARAARAAEAGDVCVATADCASGFVCAYEKAGCHGVRGTCRAATCGDLPSNRIFCACDLVTGHTGSACMPDRPYANLQACTEH